MLTPRTAQLLTAYTKLRSRLEPALLLLFSLYTALVTVNSFLCYAAVKLSWLLISALQFPVTVVACSLLLAYMCWLAQEATEAIRGLLVPLR